MAVLAAGYHWPPSELMALTARQLFWWHESLEKLEAKARRSR
jgi:hypothetical protein